MIPLVITKDLINKHRLWVFGKNSESPKRLLGKLNSRINEEEQIYLKDILSDFLFLLEDIIVGDLHRLSEIIAAFEEYLATLKRRSEVEYRKNKNGRRIKVYIDVEKLFEHLNYIFVAEYDYFGNSIEWNAYLFQKNLNLEICPYCATQNIFLYKSDLNLKKGQTRGVIDHFFDKGSYPFLAVSLYNLVPCCKVCNSDMKGKKKFDVKSYYSPYEIDIHNYIKIKMELVTNRNDLVAGNAMYEVKKKEIDIDYYGIFTGDNQDFNLKIDCSTAPASVQRKIKGNIKIFNLESLYNSYHKEYIQKEIKKLYFYDNAYREYLKKEIKVFFNTNVDFENDLYISSEYDNKKILNKLKRDILSEEKFYLERFGDFNEEN